VAGLSFMPQIFQNPVPRFPEGPLFGLPARGWSRVPLLNGSSAVPSCWSDGRIITASADPVVSTNGGKRGRTRRHHHGAVRWPRAPPIGMTRGSNSQRKPAVHDRMFGRSFPDWSREGVVGWRETIMLDSNESPARQTAFLEQESNHRSEATAEAKGRVVDTCPASAGAPSPRPGHVQPRHRQQTPRL
jgi:hypothetical protein